MKMHGMVGTVVGTVVGLSITITVRENVRAAAGRMSESQSSLPSTAVADHAEEPYCTPAFKQVLQRVLNACGLVGTESRRGCQPADVKNLATISDEDFNALFLPLSKRGAIVLFDEGSDKLDASARKLIEDRWIDRRGARYFFIVARGSKTGTVETNRSLSHRRANSVLFLLSETTHDPVLDKHVGMLWLGKEFAQLPKEFCDWPRSRENVLCDEQSVNRSAFISWVDCRL